MTKTVDWVDEMLMQERVSANEDERTDNSLRNLDADIRGHCRDF